MKTKSIIFILTIVLPLFFQSCSSPKSLVKLQPTEENTKWIYGQEFTNDSTNGIIYEVGFDQLIEPNYLFDFHITNRSNLDLLIDPKDFYYIPLNDSMQPMSALVYHALDPETEILNLEKQLSATDARRKNSFALSMVGLGVDMVTAIATATDDNPHNDFLRTDMFDAVQVGNAANEFRAADLKDLHDSWSSSTIRKTTLQPGYSMKGKVFFPYFPQANFLQIFFPVDDQLIEVIFRQQYIPVTR